MLQLFGELLNLLSLVLLRLFTFVCEKVIRGSLRLSLTWSCVGDLSAFIPDIREFQVVGVVPQRHPETPHGVWVAGRGIA